jgi:two-component system, NtrC family, response regulator GlrR
VWPGNIRELRNYLERCAVFEEPLPMAGGLDDGLDSGVDPRKPLDFERDRAMAAFEREYVQKVLELHGNNVTHAARTADISRIHLHRLMQKHGVRSK